MTPDGHTIYLSVGYDPQNPQKPRQVFYSAGFKSGSQLEFQVQDACVMFSLLLQQGLTAEHIAKSLARSAQPDGTIAYACVIGLIVEELNAT